ncbi:ribose 5-phosphate isomerase B [Clostridia bacterium]|nr:ribose 5-phosphate isomerase B [Clostridia bacterium]
MIIAMGNDNTACAMKAELKKHIEGLGHTVLDCGTHNEERCDYPVYGKLAAEAVLRGDADLAVLICGTGVGISLAANKLRGIRCAVCSEPYTALLSRRHNNANALAFGARVVGTELAKMIVDAFLSGVFEGGRHADRVAMLE